MAQPISSILKLRGIKLGTVLNIAYIVEGKKRGRKGKEILCFECTGL